MFLLKKVITAFIVPPGLFIVILFVSAAWLWRRGLRRVALLNGGVALLIWALSAGPVPTALMRGLEAGLAIPSPVHGDAIILLGGGVCEGVTDLTGTGAPSEEMFPRMVTAARLYRTMGVPIIVSGGSVYGRSAEAPVVRRFLLDLGIPEKKIILESRSRDTQENALYCRAVAKEHGFSRPILVTSAYHMRRAIEAFRMAGMEVTPLPAQFSTGQPIPFLWVDCLPGAGELMQSTKALKEYLGLLYYRLASRGRGGSSGGHAASPNAQ